MSLETASLVTRPGAHPTSEGVCFTVYSRHATALDLCLFDAADSSRETQRIPMARGERDLWQVFVPGIGPGQLYGYRAHGPWVPNHALRFNANKLLLDPYAKAVVGRPDGKVTMLSPEGPSRFPGTHDNGPEALKAAVVAGTYDWGNDRPPLTSWRDSVIYELHVKGFTRQHPELPPELRGTYAGLAHPAVINARKTRRDRTAITASASTPR